LLKTLLKANVSQSAAASEVLRQHDLKLQWVAPLKVKRRLLFALHIARNCSYFHAPE
jgi:hypothetical protein